MTPNRMMDLVALTAPEARLQHLRRVMPRGDGWTEVSAPRGWVAASRSMGSGDVPVSSDVFVLEGWPDLARWQPDLRAAEQQLVRCVAGREDVPGDVSCVRLVEGGGATVRRAPAARVPIYMHAFDDVLAITTRMDLMLLLRPEWPWQIDGLVTMSMTSANGVLPDGRSYIVDVRTIPAGHSVDLQGGSSAIGSPSRTWDPRPPTRPRRGQRDQHALELRHSVIRYLEDELEPDGGNLLSLSAGVDSSTLAALIGGTLGRRYSALSFLPSNAKDLAAETAYLDRLGEVSTPDRTWRRQQNEDDWIDAWRTATPNGVPVVHPVLLAVGEVARAGSFGALVGGEWADAACGERITVPDWLATARLPQLLRYQARLPVGEREVLDAIWRRITRRLPLHSQLALPLPVPVAASAGLREEFESFARDEVFAAQRLGEPRTRLWQELRQEQWLQQNWEVLSPLGMRRLTPFYQRRVIELAFATPADEMIGPSMKRPLRAAFAQDVPAAVLHRPKSLWPNEPLPEDRVWDRDLPTELEGIIRADWFPRPPCQLSFRDRLALAGLEAYALRLGQLRLHRNAASEV